MFNQLKLNIMETTKKNFAELLSNKSIVVNHEDVDTFVELFESFGLLVHGGADLGEDGRVIYF